MLSSVFLELWAKVLKHPKSYNCFFVMEQMKGGISSTALVRKRYPVSSLVERKLPVSEQPRSLWRDSAGTECCFMIMIFILRNGRDRQGGDTGQLTLGPSGALEKTCYFINFLKYIHI